MTLAAKISMCLALWNPDASLHPASEELLNYWFHQEMSIVAQVSEGKTEEEIELLVPYLSWEEFQQYFSLPNSSYIPIPVCIQQPSEEV